MTYNFDPEKWFDNEIRILLRSYREGKLSKRQYEDAVDALDQKREDIWNRMDGSFQMPLDESVHH